VIPEIETQIGANLTRIVADRGYRGTTPHPITSWGILAVAFSFARMGLVH
jgi:hypothetical protein